MSVPAVRRIVVGVDGSAESTAALRWACREASLRGAQVHAVHVWEAPCHSMASYAVPAQVESPESGDFDVFWKAVLPDRVPGVPVQTEVVPGLAARVLLQRCDGADMLVLGSAGDQAGTSGSGRSAGPVVRACLRRSPCPVVVISAWQDPPADRDVPGHPTDMHVPAPAGVSASAGSNGAARDVGVVSVPAGLPV